MYCMMSVTIALFMISEHGTLSWYCSRHILRGLLRDGRGRARVGLSERYDAILSWLRNRNVLLSSITLMT